MATAEPASPSPSPGFEMMRSRPTLPMPAAPASPVDLTPRRISVTVTDHSPASDRSTRRYSSYNPRVGFSTLHEGQMAAAIPLPPSEPSLSPLSSSGSRYSPSPRNSTRSFSASHSGANGLTRSHSYSHSHSRSLSHSLSPGTRTRLHTPSPLSTSIDDANARPSPRARGPSPSVSTSNLENLSRSPASLPRSQSHTLNLLSKRSSMYESTSPSPLASAPGTPSKSVDRSKRHSVGSLPRSPRLSSGSGRDLLSTLRDLQIDPERTRKRSCDHLEEDAVPPASPSVHIVRESRTRSPLTSPGVSRAGSLSRQHRLSLTRKRRESSPFLATGNGSLLDASFAIASVGDKTYDELEVAVESNRERRKSMGFALGVAPRNHTRPPVASFDSLSSLTSATAASRSSRSSASGTASTSPPSAASVPLTMRRSPPSRLKLAAEPQPEAAEELQEHDTDVQEVHTPLRLQKSVALFDKALQLKKSTIFTNGAHEETLLDADDFDLTPPSSADDDPVSRAARARSPRSPVHTPLRAQSSAGLFEDKQQLSLKKSTIFTTGADPESLLDADDFQLTPPSTLRTPTAPRTAEVPARTPAVPRTPAVGRTPARTPRSLRASRNAPLPPRTPKMDELPPVPATPSRDADMTIDLGAMIRTGRPKRPSGTEESFLVPGEVGLTLADLSAEEDDDMDIVDQELIPDALRPKRTLPASGSNGSLSELDARGLPVAARAVPSPAPASESAPEVADPAPAPPSASMAPPPAPTSAPMPPPPVPRSESARNATVARSESMRSLGNMTESKRADRRLSALPSSASARSLQSLAGLARGTTTPRRPSDRPDVPLTMRRNPITGSTRTRGAVPAPPAVERDRWADAVERHPAPPPAEPEQPARRLPAASMSSRRTSTATSATSTAGVTRANSTRSALTTERPSATVTRTSSTRTSTGTLPRSGSARGERAPSRESNGGLSRGGSAKGITRPDSGATASATPSVSSRKSAAPSTSGRVSLAPSTTSRMSAPPASRLAPRTSTIAPRTSTIAPRTSTIVPRGTSTTSTASATSALAPKTSTLGSRTGRTSLAPRSSLAPRASAAAAGTAGTTPATTGTASSRRSMLPPPIPTNGTVSGAASTTASASSTGTVSRLAARSSSRPSLSVRPRPFGDTAPTTNRAGPASATVARTKASAPPSLRDAPEPRSATLGHKRHQSTPATTASATATRPVAGTHTRRQSTLPTLNEFGMMDAPKTAPRGTMNGTVGAGKPPAPPTAATRTSSRPSTLGGVRARIGEIEARTRRLAKF